MAKAPRAASADNPNEPTHYRVTVKDIFTSHNELFQPGNKYDVTAEIYQNIKDKCATAVPVFRKR